jgi:hypothetical protein
VGAAAGRQQNGTERKGDGRNANRTTGECGGNRIEKNEMFSFITNGRWVIF